MKRLGYLIYLLSTTYAKLDYGKKIAGVLEKFSQPF